MKRLLKAVRYLRGRCADNWLELGDNHAEVEKVAGHLYS